MKSHALRSSLARQRFPMLKNPASDRLPRAAAESSGAIAWIRVPRRKAPPLAGRARVDDVWGVVEVR